MKLKKITAVMPLIGVFLIFNGFLKLYLYYNHWGIRISDYLDISEILLSFMNDLSLLGFGVLLVLIYAFIWIKFIDEVDKKTTSPAVTNALAGSESTVPEKESAMEKIGKIFDGIVEHHHNLISIIALGVTLVAATCFFFFTNLFWLYFSSVLIGQFIIILIVPYFKDVEDIAFKITTMLVTITFTFGVTYYDIKKTEKHAPLNISTISTNEEQITTTSTFYIIGKSTKYLFLFDSKAQRTTVLSTDQVKKMELSNSN